MPLLLLHTGAGAEIELEASAIVSLRDALAPEPGATMITTLDGKARGVRESRAEIRALMLDADVAAVPPATS